MNSEQEIHETIKKEIPQRVGGIHTYYGGLEIYQADGKYYWGLQDYDGTNWEEIPESLYWELIAFAESRQEG